MICARDACDKEFNPAGSPSNAFCSEGCQRSWAVQNTATSDREPDPIIPEVQYPMRPVGPDEFGRVPWWEKRGQAA